MTGARAVRPNFFRQSNSLRYPLLQPATGAFLFPTGGEIDQILTATCAECLPFTCWIVCLDARWRTTASAVTQSPRHGNATYMRFSAEISVNSASRTATADFATERECQIASSPAPSPPCDCHVGCTRSLVHAARRRRQCASRRALLAPMRAHYRIEAWLGWLRLTTLGAQMRL